MTPAQRQQVRALTEDLPNRWVDLDRRWLLLEIPSLELEHNTTPTAFGLWLEAWGIPVRRAGICGLRAGSHPLRAQWSLVVLACRRFRRVPTGSAAPIVSILDPRLRPPAAA